MMATKQQLYKKLVKEKGIEAYLDIIARKICHHESLGESAGTIPFSPVPCDGAREVDALVGWWGVAGGHVCVSGTLPRFTDYP